jgi:outer membrane protein assembly factor BamB
MNIKLLALGLFTFGASLALAADPVGWRRNTSGRFPGATPPTEWSTEEHVVWKTRIESASNASPVVVADRVFVCAEPTRLVCLNAADGTLVWEQDHGFDLVLDPETLSQARIDIEAADVIRARLEPVRKRAGEVEASLQQSPDDADLKAELETLRKEIAAGDEELKPLEQYRVPQRSAGCTTATPVSDGRNVHAVFGTGIIVSYDLEGKRRWIKLLDRPSLDWGHTASPLLIGDLLLVHITDLVALDARTGSERWRAKLKPSYGSPVRARIGKIDVVVTAAGDVVQAGDGKVLATGIAPALTAASPIVEGNVVYFIQAAAQAVRLPDRIADPLAVETLWEAKLFDDNYYASPVYHDGLIYTASQDRMLTVLEAKTGEVVYEERLRFEEGAGAVTSSLATANDLVFVLQETGRGKVLQAGREYEELVENPLESLRSSPIFAGERLYVRGAEHVWCVGK